MNEGTPSVLLTNVSTTSTGKILPCASRTISASTWKRSNPLSVNGVICERVGQGGTNSGRKAQQVAQRRRRRLIDV